MHLRSLNPCSRSFPCKDGISNAAGSSRLEDCEAFSVPVFEERGVYDTELVERCVVSKAIEMKEQYPESKAILLECSLLPPFAHAVGEATGLPVFDYITMIDYVHDAVVQRTFTGHM